VLSTCRDYTGTIARPARPHRLPAASTAKRAEPPAVRKLCVQRASPRAGRRARPFLPAPLLACRICCWQCHHPVDAARAAISSSHISMHLHHIHPGRPHTPMGCRVPVPPFQVGNLSKTPQKLPLENFAILNKSPSKTFPNSFQDFPILSQTFPKPDKDFPRLHEILPKLVPNLYSTNSLSELSSDTAHAASVCASMQIIPF
jgi:hypothetical protein